MLVAIITIPQATRAGGPWNGRPTGRSSLTPLDPIPASLPWEPPPGIRNAEINP
ncbi:hypothetical protein Sru01_37090 [Sphaerisporangium rufum]|uniref:Uncharacterized protein n=1 Tax=Sphaerisporangium rufum TaxID=1381558 RepID=A0A919R7P3_9ACTN|nr:hypothetical protein Sru01_37090 [Sphaerisporangium rufum]